MQDIENQAPLLEHTQLPQKLTFYCAICYTDYDQNQTPIKFLEKCGHTFCADCFKDNYRCLIEDMGQTHNLKCPEFECKVHASEAEIKELLETDCFQKFLKFRRNKEVAADANLMFCPTPNCEGVLSRVDAKKNLIACAFCKMKTCAKCRMPAHGKVSCEKNPELQLEKWATGQVKIHQCPKCGTRIEKDGGCPHMYCTVCSHNWCWTCGFPEKHFFHSVMFGGFLCGALNAFSFGFEVKIHWTLRLIITILAITFAPVIFLIGSLIAFFVVYMESIQYGETRLLFCIEAPSNKFLLVLWFIAYII